MKKSWLIIFMSVFLFAFIGSAVAMSEPITIIGNEGNNFRFYIRQPDTNSLLYFESEDFNEEGIFSKTFFTLNEPNPKYQIKIYSASDLISEETFEGYGIENALAIDCKSSSCVISVGKSESDEDEISIDEISEETGDEVIEEEIVVEEIVEETSEVTENEKLEDKTSKFSFTGNSIFSSEDGLINWGYLVGGIFSFLLIISVVIMAVLHRKKSKNEEPDKKNEIGFDPEEMELKQLEEKIKAKEDEIKRIKEKRMRHQKLIEAKEKLKQEENEISNLEAGNEDIVMAKQKLENKERELNALKRISGNQRDNNLSFE